MKHLTDLNKQQLASVITDSTQTLVVAGAGSGKTKVLVNRVAWLIAERGVNPYSIMAVTFTNKAANEMKERISEMIDFNTRWMWIGTFHSLCLRMLRFDGEKMGLPRNFVIYDDNDSRSLIKRCMAELMLDDDKKYPPAAVLASISEAKNKLISVRDYQQQAHDDWTRNIGRIYQRYQSSLAANKALDFDDLLCQTVWGLEKNPELLMQFRQRFQHILVDEYQDTNHCQYRLIKLLAGEDGKIFAVGDPDQSIYRWRGADINNILDFNSDFPAAKEIQLTQNYRSTQNILDAANVLIANNKSRRPKDLFTEGERGEKIIVHQADSDREEASYVIRTIAGLIEQGEHALSDFAVLYRTHGQSRLLEDECIRYNIPYRVYGGIKFYDRKEVRDTIAYLRLLVNPYDSESMRRIYNEPRRGIGRATWDKLTEYAGRQNMPIWEALSQIEQMQLTSATQKKLQGFYQLMLEMQHETGKLMSVADIIRMVWEKSTYSASIAAGENAEDKTDILEQLLDTAADFDLLYAELQQDPDAAEMLEEPLNAFLSQLSLATDLDNASTTNGCVTLMTLHAAKGLEFNAIFLVGMEEGIFPHKRIIFSTDESELEEERRLCYVGITRARQRLWIIAANRRQVWGKYETNKISRFVAELPAQVIQKTGIAPRENRLEKPQPGTRMTGNLFVPRVAVEKAPPTPAQMIEISDKVFHTKFGEGVVVASNGSGDDMQITVAFPDHGIKKLMWKYAPMKKI